MAVNIDPEKTGKFIAELRAKLNMTQEELGEKVFVTRKAVSKWETGSGCPSLDTLNKLTEVLGVSYDELVAGKFLDYKNLSKREIVMNVLKSKHFKILSTILLVFILLIVTIVIVLDLNADKIYLINYEDENFTITKGILVLSKDRSYINLGNFYSNLSDVSDDIVYETKLYYHDKHGEEHFLLDLNYNAIIYIDDELYTEMKEVVKSNLDLFLHVEFKNIDNMNNSYDLELSLTEGSNRDKEKQKIPEYEEIDEEPNIEEGINLSFLFEMSPEELEEKFFDKDIIIDNSRFQITYNKESSIFKIEGNDYKLFLSFLSRRLNFFNGDNYFDYILNKNNIVLFGELTDNDYRTIVSIFSKLKEMI